MPLAGYRTVRGVGYLRSPQTHQRVRPVRLGVGTYPLCQTPLAKLQPGAAFRVIQAADHNFRQLQAAFLNLVETVKQQIRVRELEEALQIGLSAVLGVLDLDGRMERVAAGAGLKPGETSFLDALQATFRSGADGAIEDLGRVAVMKSVGAQMAFDSMNPEAVAALSKYNFELIREISTETRLAIGDVVSEAFREGGHPREQARTIRNMVGLTRRQSRAVDNFRRNLESGDPVRMRAAMERALRDRRFDPTVFRAIQQQTRLSQARIKQMTDRYYARYLKYRAGNIARTETIRASHMGQQEVWRQAVDQKLLDPNTKRKWIVTFDGRTCKICRPIPGLNRGGVLLEEDFQTPLGPKKHPPAHPSCRCAVGLKTPGAAPSAEEAPPVMLNSIEGAPSSFTDLPMANRQAAQTFLTQTLDIGLRDLPQELRTEVIRGARVMDAGGLSTKLVEKTSFRKLGLDKRPGFQGGYDAKGHRIVLNPSTADRGTIIHEYGHHVDTKLFQTREVAIKDEYFDLFFESQAEYSSALADASTKLGTKVTEATYQRMSRQLYANESRLNSVSAYALKNDREWFAESWTQYFKNKDRLKKIAPKTFELMEGIAKGEALQ